MIYYEKIRLGVVFDQQIYAGGGYQQSLNAALIASQIPEDVADVNFYTTFKENIEILKSYNIHCKLLKFSLISKFRIYFYRKIKNTYLFKFLRLFEKRNPREEIFLKDKIDIVYFLSPTSWPIDLEKTNYITTVWDLCHRNDLEFPEVRWNREFERRENNYLSILPKALAILVESDNTRINLVKRYGIDESRIYITPFQGAKEIRNESIYKSQKVIDMKKKYGLSVPYIFYPAQFWPHKNHIYLLEGLKYLQDVYGISIGAIFTGKDYGNLNYIKKNVMKLGLSERICFAGFVENKEMLELYRQSVALVMPTYFGPTNLPILEAFEIGTPVLYSDKEGLRDQIGEAALLMDLKNSKSMALQLKNLIEDNQLRNKLIIAGRKKINENNSIDQIAILRSIIENFSYKRKCWQ